MLQLTDRELGAVLAGLRMYQDLRLVTDYVEYDNIATDGGSFCALSWPEVDDLCERLNETTLCYCGPAELGPHSIRDHIFNTDDEYPDYRDYACSH